MKKLIPVLLILFTLIVLAGCEKEPVIEKFTVTFDPDNGKEKTEVTVKRERPSKRLPIPRRTDASSWSGERPTAKNMISRRLS